MCIDVEPNIFVSEKALDNLQNGFDFYDSVEIETHDGTTYNLVKEPKFNRIGKFFFGFDTVKRMNKKVLQKDVKTFNYKGRHFYNDGYRVDF